MYNNLLISLTPIKCLFINTDAILVGLWTLHYRAYTHRLYIAQSFQGEMKENVLKSDQNLYDSPFLDELFWGVLGGNCLSCCVQPCTLVRMKGCFFSLHIFHNVFECSIERFIKFSKYHRPCHSKVLLVFKSTVSLWFETSGETSSYIISLKGWCNMYRTFCQHFK